MLKTLQTLHVLTIFFTFGLSFGIHHFFLFLPWCWPLPRVWSLGEDVRLTSVSVYNLLGKLVCNQESFQRTLVRPFLYFLPVSTLVSLYLAEFFSAALLTHRSWACLIFSVHKAPFRFILICFFARVLSLNLFFVF